MKYGQPSARVVVQPAIQLQDSPFSDDDDAASSDKTFDPSSRECLIVIHDAYRPENR